MLKVQVEHRLSELLASARSSYIAEFTECLPHHCVHNYRHSLDQRKLIGSEANPDYNRVTSSKRSLPVLQTIGLCMLGSDDPESWSGTICEEPLDAKRCGDFTLARPESALLAEFERLLQDNSWVELNLPQVHILRWVLSLEGGTDPSPILVEAPPVPVEAPQTPVLFPFCHCGVPLENEWSPTSCCPECDKDKIPEVGSPEHRRQAALPTTFVEALPLVTVRVTLWDRILQWFRSFR